MVVYVLEVIRGFPSMCHVVISAQYKPTYTGLVSITRELCYLH